MGRWVLAATILASSMAFIDGTVVNVALPFLQTDLNATAIGIQWVVEAYSLFLSALLLVGGSLGDLYGRRRIFNIGVVIFTVASALCGFAVNIEQLITRPGKSRAYQFIVRRGQTRQSDRHVVRILRYDNGDRPGAWRLAGREYFLARRVFSEPAARAGGAIDINVESAGEP
jgi:hypothetical protein